MRAARSHGLRYKVATRRRSGSALAPSGFDPARGLVTTMPPKAGPFLPSGETPGAGRAGTSLSGDQPLNLAATDEFSSPKERYDEQG